MTSRDRWVQSRDGVELIPVDRIARLRLVRLGGSDLPTVVELFAELIGSGERWESLGVLASAYGPAALAELVKALHSPEAQDGPGPWFIWLREEYQDPAASRPAGTDAEGPARSAPTSFWGISTEAPLSQWETRLWGGPHDEVMAHQHDPTPADPPTMDPTTTDPRP